MFDADGFCMVVKVGLWCAQYGELLQFGYTSWGHFEKGCGGSSDLRYIGGRTNWWDDVDLDRISLPVIWELLKQVGYLVYQECYYLIPGMTLDKGLRRLKTDEDCLEMIQVVNGHEELLLYIEHAVSQPEEVPLIEAIEDAGLRRTADNMQGEVEEEVAAENEHMKSTEVLVEETYSTLTARVDWEEIEVEEICATGSPAVPGSEVDIEESKGQRAKRNAVDYVNGEVIGEEGSNDGLSDDYDSVEDEAYKYSMGDHSKDDDLLFERHTEKEPALQKSQKYKKQPSSAPKRSQSQATQSQPFIIDAEVPCQAEDGDNYHQYGSEEVHSVDESSDVRDESEDEGEGMSGRTSKSAASEGSRKRRKKEKKVWPQFNDKMTYEKVKFEVDQVFPNLDKFKDAVKDYAVFEGRAVWLEKNDAIRCKAKCATSKQGLGILLKVPNNQSKATPQLMLRCRKTLPKLKF